MKHLKDIVETMTKQHRILQKDLTETLALSSGNQSKIKQISPSLKRFSADLTAHLNLENKIFYPELLQRMQAKGENTSDTVEFIAEMDKIGVVVGAFLQKYQTISSSTEQLIDFSKELINIISTLNLRIESEESGVYGYWEMYK